MWCYGSDSTASSQSASSPALLNCWGLQCSVPWWGTWNSTIHGTLVGIITAHIMHVQSIVWLMTHNNKIQILDRPSHLVHLLRLGCVALKECPSQHPQSVTLSTVQKQLRNNNGCMHTLHHYQHCLNCIIKVLMLPVIVPGLIPVTGPAPPTPFALVMPPGHRLIIGRWWSACLIIWIMMWQLPGHWY